MRNVFGSSADAIRVVTEMVASRASAEIISAGRILVAIFSPCLSKTPAGRLPSRQHSLLSGKAAAVCGSRFPYCLTRLRYETSLRSVKRNLFLVDYLRFIAISEAEGDSFGLLLETAASHSNTRCAMVWVRSSYPEASENHGLFAQCAAPQQREAEKGKPDGGRPRVIRRERRRGRQDQPRDAPEAHPDGQRTHAAAGERTDPGR